MECRVTTKSDGKKTHGAKNQSSNTQHINTRCSTVRRTDGACYCFFFYSSSLITASHYVCLSLFRLDIHVFVLVVHKIYIYHSCSLCSKGSIVCSVCLSVCVYVYTFRLESVVSLAALYKSPSDCWVLYSSWSCCVCVCTGGSIRQQHSSSSCI